MFLELLEKAIRQSGLKHAFGDHGYLDQITAFVSEVCKEP